MKKKGVKKMTKEEWARIENKLSSPFGYVKLKIDGYNVVVEVRQYKPLHNVLAVFIDGEFKMKWCLEDCEERRRFCFKHKSSLLTAQQRKKLKRECKAVREEVERKLTVYTYYPFWNSFRSLKAHFIKNNTSIELVEDY